MVELVVMRIFVQHRIFNAIPDDNDNNNKNNGISISELSSKTQMEYNPLERFSNFLVAAGVLSSPAPGYITLTPVSKMFKEEKATLFYSHIFDYFIT